jgi:hypothetical protein
MLRRAIPFGSGFITIQAGGPSSSTGTFADGLVRALGLARAAMARFELARHRVGIERLCGTHGREAQVAPAVEVDAVVMEDLRALGCSRTICATLMLRSRGVRTFSEAGFVSTRNSGLSLAPRQRRSILEHRRAAEEERSAGSIPRFALFDSRRAGVSADTPCDSRRTWTVRRRGASPSPARSSIVQRRPAFQVRRGRPRRAP